MCYNGDNEIKEETTMCIFCDIIEGKIPSYRIYEDEDVLAFLDISQVTKGHTLVIPKAHCDHFLECDPQLMCKLMCIAQKIANHLMESLHANGMHLLSNINEAAGQSVPHFHVHLIPRYEESDACKITFEASEPQDLEALAKQLAL